MFGMCWWQLRHVPLIDRPGANPITDFLLGALGPAQAICGPKTRAPRKTKGLGPGARRAVPLRLGLEWLILNCRIGSKERVGGLNARRNA